LFLDLPIKQISFQSALIRKSAVNVFCFSDHCYPSISGQILPFRFRAMSAMTGSPESHALAFWGGMTAIPAIGARCAPTPSPTPYVHPISPKVTQYTQESAEGRNPYTQTPSLKGRVLKHKKTLWIAGWAPIKPGSGLVG
jgi:hypothetical protein